MSEDLDLASATEIDFVGIRPEDDEDAWTTETLFRLQDGSFALKREGGMNSALMGATEVNAISNDEAREWMTKHSRPERIADVFGS